MSKEELFTGERFVPGIDDPELEIEHYQRYNSILDIVKNKVVVDAACGEGYGTAIIGKVAKKVVGIDIDERAVKRAKENYGNDVVTFQQGDVSNLPLADGSVDVFVSFETIEHINEELQIKFLSEVKRVLNKNGIFIISSPNKKIYSDLFNYHNEFHVHELYKEEFVNLLQARFENIKLFNQYFEVASVIDSNSSYQDTALYEKNREKYRSDGKYFIAVASDDEIDDIVIQSVYLSEQVTYRNNIKRILDLQEEEEFRNKHIHTLDQHIEELGKGIQWRDGQIQDKEEALEKCKAEIQQKEAEIQQKEAELEKHKDDGIAYQYELEQKNKMVYDKDVHIANLENIIRAHERSICELQIPAGKWVKLVHFFPLRVIRYIKRHLKMWRMERKENKQIVLELPKYEKPKVSIIIPVYNQFQYTYNCIKSILDTVEDVPYEVIVGDDESTDKTRKITKIIRGVRVNINHTDHGFLMNCNRAAQLAKGEYVLFLNNDTQVKENWLSSLLELIESDDRIGMVGSKLIYPDGGLQEAGGIVWKDASGWNYGRNQNPDMPEYNYVREVDYISGASIMLRTSLWKELGGFDERFKPAYCEDSDLAFQVRKAGYKVMYQPESVVVHFEGISNGTDLDSGLKKYQVENSEKFKEKWKDELVNQCEPGEEVFKAKDRLYDKKTVLFIDHYVPTFDKDAGSRTVYQYIKIFLKKGYVVKFIGDNYAKMEPYVSILQQMGVEVYYGIWHMNHIFEYLKNNEKYIDFVFLNRPHISIKYIDFIKNNMHAKVMFYGSDLHYLRIQREAKVLGLKEKEKEALYWKNIEYKLLEKVDVAYYLSPVEKEEINKNNSSICVKNMKINIFETFKQDLNLEFSERHGILFVGGFTHAPNLDAVNWYIDEIFPKVWNQVKAPFVIVGSNAPDELKSLKMEGVELKGFVSDEELEQLYDECRIAIVPLRYGAGIKGKVIEALYNGIPLITTSVGAEGISKIDEYAMIEDNPEVLAEKIIQLYSDVDRLKEMALNSQAFVKNEFSEEAAWNVIEEDFT